MAVIRSMSGLGDLDLHLLEGGGALTEVETTSPMHTTSSLVVSGSGGSGTISRGLKRAKSDTTANGTVGQQVTGLKKVSE